MSEPFDPYHLWLGVPPKDQPPNHYRLLAIELFEDNRDVIAAAADQRIVHLRTYQLGKHVEWTQRLLNEVAAAKVCLLNREKKAAYGDGSYPRRKQGGGAAAEAPYGHRLTWPGDPGERIPDAPLPSGPGRNADPRPEFPPTRPLPN